MNSNVLFKGKSLFSQDFDDIYFSKDFGLEESVYVFLHGNKLPARWLCHEREDFVVGEFGFGAALNFLVTIKSFMENKSNLHRLYFISFERFPLSLSVLKQVYSNFPELADYANWLFAEYKDLNDGCNRIVLAEGRIVLDLWIGDIRTNLPIAELSVVDAWYLDGFSPAKNAAMWTDVVFDSMAKHSAATSTFATFTAAGFVKRALQSRGFTVTKNKGFLKKREMLVGSFNSITSTNPTKSTAKQKTKRNNKIAVVGAGVAAFNILLSLHKRGFSADVFSKNTTFADGASGNHQALIYPLLVPDNKLLTTWFVQSFSFLKRRLAYLQQYCPVSFDLCGVLKIPSDDKDFRKLTKVASDPYCGKFFNLLDADQASKAANLDLDTPCFHIPDGGWIAPRSYLASMYSVVKSTSKFNFACEVVNFRKHLDQWLLFDKHNNELGSYDTLILANGAGIFDFRLFSEIPLTKIRGQIELAQKSSDFPDIKKVICSKRYFTPSFNGFNCYGASYVRNFDDLNISCAESLSNRVRLLSSFNSSLSWVSNFPKNKQSRVSVRVSARDHMPFMGKAAPGVYILTGLGSRGFVTSALAAETLVSLLSGDPLPVSYEHLNAIGLNRRL